MMGSLLRLILYLLFSYFTFKVTFHLSINLYKSDEISGHTSDTAHPAHSSLHPDNHGSIILHL